ncbi:MAG: hypothetical protein QW594_02405 [Candidatus Woesearchaeota archaeon]
MDIERQENKKKHNKKNDYKQENKKNYAKINDWKNNYNQANLTSVLFDVCLRSFLPAILKFFYCLWLNRFEKEFWSVLNKALRILEPIGFQELKYNRLKYTS